MRKIRNLLVALIFLLPIPQYATTTVNLTPVPKEMTVQEGQLLLPEEIKINSGSLSAEMTTEVQNFATALRIATGRDYAFQSVKKMLPANMMAGKSDATVTEYALPLIRITHSRSCIMLSLRFINKCIIIKNSTKTQEEFRSLIMI